MERRDEHLADEVAAAGAEMIPVVGSIAGVFTKRTFAKMREERERRVSVALSAAERIAGMSREELGDAIEEDPDLVPLVTRILFAAGMNGYNRALSAMGRALGDAVRDRERLGEAELILTALVDLGEAHIRVLQTVASPADEPTWGVMKSTPHIMELSGLSRRVVGLCLASLISRGLVTLVAGQHSVSELGRTLLEVLAELETDED
jgi:hypothetical protein